MKHKVLILGTLGEFTELVKKAKEKGYETVVCDGYADGIARTYADKAYTIPVTDVDAIALMCREEGVDGIITSFSDLLLECMVKIADKAGLPCYLKPEQLSWYQGINRHAGCSGQAWTAGTGISENICGTAETGIRRRNTTEYCKSAVSSDQ